MEAVNHPMRENENIGLLSVLVSGLRRWKLFAVTFVCLIPCAVLYLVLVPTTYEVSMRILVQEEEDGSASFGLGEAGGLMKSFGLGKMGSGSISIDDEMVILSSHSLLRKVIRSLDMQAEYHKPGSLLHKLYTDNSPLLLHFTEETGDGVGEVLTFKVDVGEEGVQVKVKERSGPKYSFSYRSLPAVIRLPQGDFTLVRNPRLSAGSGEFTGKMRIVVQPLSWLAEELSTRIMIEDETKNSDVINLGYQDHERGRATDVLEALVKAYNIDHASFRRQRTMIPLDFIESRIGKVMSELSETESELQDFKHQNQLTDLEFDMQFYIDQLQEVQSQLISTEAEAYVISMMEDFVRDPENRYSMVPLLMSVRDGESGNSSVILYNETLLTRTQLLRSARAESPLVLRLDDQLDRLREGVIQSVAQAHAGYKQMLTDLRRREKLIRDKMGEVPTLEKEYVDYKRRQEIFQGVYLILLQKREELALTVGQLQDRARVVEAVYIKRKRAAPRKLYAGLGLMVLTLVLPVGSLFVRRQYRVIREEMRSLPSQG
jgi:uncharacterized protein involved in exopolysaccharide biosynthesis